MTKKTLNVQVCLYIVCPQLCKPANHHYPLFTSDVGRENMESIISNEEGEGRKKKGKSEVHE